MVHNCIVPSNWRRNAASGEHLNRRAAVRILSSVAVLGAMPLSLRAQGQIWPKVKIVGNTTGRTIVSLPAVGTGLSDEMVQGLSDNFRVCLLDLDETPPNAPELYTAEWVS